MAGLSDFINNIELSTIIMDAIPEIYKNTMEWEFTLDYGNKKIDTLEVWKTSKRKNKDKFIIDLTKIFTEYQLKKFFLTVILKFDSKVFQHDSEEGEN